MTPVAQQRIHQTKVWVTPSYYLLISGVIGTNELQVWFVAEHVVDTPAVRVDA